MGLIEHEKWHMFDAAKQNDFWIEANFKEKDEVSNEGKVLKFTFPDGKVSYIKRDDLNQILFSIGDPETQRKLIPQKITHIRNYETTLGITAQKDIKKGEQIVCRVKIALPKMEEEIIGEIRTMAKEGRIKQIKDGNVPIIGDKKLIK